MFYLIFYLAVSLVHLLIFMNTTFSASLFHFIFKKSFPDFSLRVWCSYKQSNIISLGRWWCAVVCGEEI